ncbi:transcriptional regulator with XRE-family HTH domain [Nitrobacteraceae bacterium AZCC 2146]
MPSLSELAPLTPEQRADYGVARAKSIAFEAVLNLWRRRRDQGKTQAELAKSLGRDEGWLSKNLRGPGNWTMKTFGELVEALDGDIEIVVHGNEDTLSTTVNSHAYAGYEPQDRIVLTSRLFSPVPMSTGSAAPVVGASSWMTTHPLVSATPSVKS